MTTKAKQVQGNLIDLAKAGHFDVIVHGCNCFCTMGAGIAAQIAKAWPKAEIIDSVTGKGFRGKLGRISFVLEINVIVVNAYTQYEPGRNFDYDAIRQCFRNIKALFHGKKIAYPKIGAGIAGGDWNTISQIIEEELADEDHTLVVLA